MLVTETHEQTGAGDIADTVTEFDMIFNQHWSRVYAVLFRITGDESESEDLALEIFWKLYRRMENNISASRIHSLSGWLYRAATNAGLNALRSRKRRERYESESGIASLEEGMVQDPAETVENAEESAQVRRVLASMKSRAAKLLILRYSGLSYAEIAVALRVSPGSVGTLLARAEKVFEERYCELEGR